MFLAAEYAPPLPLLIIAILYKIIIEPNIEVESLINQSQKAIQQSAMMIE
jgi:hypothetical protein